MPRAYHHGDLKNALLDAAERVIDEEGIAAVTMSKVAKLAGVSSGAPYRHFEDRVALLRALCERAQAQLSTMVAEIMGQAPDPLEGFRRTGVAYVLFAVENPALFRVLGRGEFIDRRSPANQIAEDHAFADALEKLLTQGDPDAPIDPADPTMQQLAARCLVHGLAHMFVDGALGALGVGPEQARRVAEALTFALGPPRLARKQAPEDAAERET